MKNSKFESLNNSKFNEVIVSDLNKVKGGQSNSYPTVITNRCGDDNQSVRTDNDCAVAHSSVSSK